MVPKERVRDITYGLITCLIWPKKIHKPNRMRLVAGGDRVHYPFDAGTPTVDGGAGLQYRRGCAGHNFQRGPSKEILLGRRGCNLSRNTTWSIWIHGYQSLVDGTYDFPPDMDDATRELFKEIAHIRSKVPSDSVNGLISRECWQQRCNKVKEDTSSPSLVYTSVII